MSSISRKIKDKKRPRGNAYQQLDPYREPISAEAEHARQKLNKIPEYLHQRPPEVRKMAVDLTSAAIMKSMWFEDGEEGGEGERAPVAQLAGPRRVYVELFLSHPHEDHRESTFTGSSSGPDSVERRFERFCSYGLCSEAALRVDGVYLKWESNSLVIPKGRKIRDESEGAQPLSIGDEVPMGLGESEKLDDLLDLIADIYNGKRIYNSISLNTKAFVRDALHRLGKDIPPLLVVFENYRQRISDACQGIKKEFRNHRDLDEYFSRTDHATITKKKIYVEYLFFVCVCFHVKSVGGRAHVSSRQEGTRDRSIAIERISSRDCKWACPELDCCLPFLISNLPEDGLIFDQFWQTFTENGGH